MLMFWLQNIPDTELTSVSHDEHMQEWLKDKEKQKVVKQKMAEVKVGENESIESALRRFKKKFKKPEFFQK